MVANKRKSSQEDNKLTLLIIGSILLILAIGAFIYFQSDSDNGLGLPDDFPEDVDEEIATSPITGNVINFNTPVTEEQLRDGYLLSRGANVIKWFVATEALDEVLDIDVAFGSILEDASLIYNYDERKYWFNENGPYAYLNDHSYYRSRLMDEVKAEGRYYFIMTDESTLIYTPEGVESTPIVEIGSRFELESGDIVFTTEDVEAEKKHDFNIVTEDIGELGVYKFLYRSVSYIGSVQIPFIPVAGRLPPQGNNFQAMPFPLLQSDKICDELRSPVLDYQFGSTLGEVRFAPQLPTRYDPQDNIHSSGDSFITDFVSDVLIVSDVDTGISYYVALGLGRIQEGNSFVYKMPVSYPSGSYSTNIVSVDTFNPDAEKFGRGVFNYTISGVAKSDLPQTDNSPGIYEANFIPLSDVLTNITFSDSGFSDSPIAENQQIKIGDLELVLSKYLNVTDGMELVEITVVNGNVAIDRIYDSKGNYIKIPLSFHIRGKSHSFWVMDIDGNHIDTLEVGCVVK
jgi:hypothetical protein